MLTVSYHLSVMSCATLARMATRRGPKGEVERVIAANAAAPAPPPNYTGGGMAGHPISDPRYTEEGHLLTEELVNLRAKGRTWMQIQMETGVPAQSAAVRVSDYLNGQYASTSIEEARQLQIRRLEMIMGYLYEQVAAGDFLTQGRHTTNLIATIQQVTELLDLKKDRLRDEQIKLTQEQTGLIGIILDEVRSAVLDQVMQLLTEKSTYHADTGMRSVDDVAGMRAVLERDWGGWFATAAADALELASGDSNSAAGAPNAPTTRQQRGATIPGETV